MSAAAISALAYQEPGKLPSVVLAVLVHVLLAAFLFFGVRWQSSHPEVVEVELWNNLPAPTVEKEFKWEAASNQQDISGSEQDTHNLSLAAQGRYKNGPWLTEMNGAGLLNSLISPNPPIRRPGRSPRRYRKFPRCAS